MVTSADRLEALHWHTFGLSLPRSYAARQSCRIEQVQRGMLTSGGQWRQHEADCQHGHGDNDDDTS